ncbi:hypothetical protein AB0O29_36300, partial [Streptomyces sp. NPDC089915]
MSATPVPELVSVLLVEDDATIRRAVQLSLERYGYRVWPPVTIDGRRYVDGGIRSSVNADLASGYRRV